MKTNIYVDGFNLYHRALKNTPHKWLNLVKLAQLMCPTDHIRRVHYFTARVIPRAVDPSQSQRQHVYWRALETLPNLEIHLGVFRNRYKSGILVSPKQTGLTIGTVKAPEEKRSDVNLATRLLVDAFNGHFEKAVIITDDSDFVEPFRYVREGLGLKVVVFNPARRKRSNTDLANAASNVYTISQEHLASSQFPHELADATGRTITKPRSW